ncbi:hypothetical protein AN948_05165 [Rhodococcus sp. ADH]|uniref:hypothetical protein n=1 Tax=Nocardiaceae TaxID=85025 RepID=UPI0006BA58F3|nr:MULTISPECIES: hypothetical protein [Rhodococcus]KPH20752.1 hypothetical protein AN948_05165 [Rhodococcus sp. ADH]
MKGPGNNDISATRDGVVKALCALNDTTKRQQSLLNSCSDAEWLGEDERRAVRSLLDALIEHRRRVRVMIRLWRSLCLDDVLEEGLVRETSQIIDENRYFVPHVDKWRNAVIKREGLERELFWRGMIDLAQANLGESVVLGEQCVQ